MEYKTVRRSCTDPKGHRWRRAGVTSAGNRRRVCGACSASVTESSRMHRDARSLGGSNGTYFSNYWTRLARGMVQHGLETTHSQLMAEFEEAGFGHSTISKWLHNVAFDDLPSLPEIDGSLRQLLEATVALHRDRKTTPVPTMADATLQVVPPRIGSAPGDEEARCFWGALVEARSIASAHRGIAYPLWLDDLAPDAHPFRRLLAKVSPDADYISGRHLQYWVDLSARRLEVMVQFRGVLVGRALRRNVSLTLEQGFVGRLLFHESERLDSEIRIPIKGRAGTPFVVAAPPAGAAA
jgi:hypothetical protein